MSCNPIYVVLAGLLAANALRCGPVVYGLPVAGFVGALTPQIAAEEAVLLDRFGDDYAQYRQRVPRWLT